MIACCARAHARRLGSALGDSYVRQFRAIRAAIAVEIRLRDWLPIVERFRVRCDSSEGTSHAGRLAQAPLHYSLVVQ